MIKSTSTTCYDNKNILLTYMHKIKSKKEKETHSNNRVSEANLREEKRNPVSKRMQARCTSCITKWVHVQKEYPFLACSLLLIIPTKFTPWPQFLTNGVMRRSRNGSKNSTEFPCFCSPWFLSSIPCWDGSWWVKSESGFYVEVGGHDDFYHFHHWCWRFTAKLELAM